MAFTAIFDADVLYPFAQRDLLVRLAARGLFSGRWTVQILDEMERAIVRRQPELTGRLTRTRELMCAAVPDCLVEGYEELIDALSLPDPNDRHVLAAAIRCGAQVIVTNNQRDFPSETLDPYGIEAQSADEFVLYLTSLNLAAIAGTLRQQSEALDNPPMSLNQVLDALARGGLEKSVADIRGHLDV